MKIYVTGMGMISAIGHSAAESRESLLTERSGLRLGRHLVSRHRDHFVVGEVNLSDEELTQRVQSNQVLTRTTALGYLAAREAVTQAGLEEKDYFRTGLISSTTVGGVVRTERHYGNFLAGQRGIPFVDTHDAADSTEFISRQLGIHHFITTINTACASSLNVVVVGARMIRCGLLDRVIVGGTDALCRFTLNGFNSLMLLDPEPCKSFDENRKGINLGEGAAYLVLESEEAVAKRGITPVARLSGYGATNDAYHQSASSPHGDGLQASMKAALTLANLAEEAIDYINAHGTSTPNNDLTEGWAMKDLFRQGVPRFSSTKAFTGHTLAAAGTIESVIAILALQNGFIPPNLHFKKPIAEHQLQPVTSLLVNERLQHVLSNSAGMGGACASVIFSQN